LREEPEFPSTSAFTGFLSSASSMSKVDVIITTYNRSEFLESAIKSVLNQTFQNLSIVIVDDASEDGTQGAIKSFGHPKIRYIKHKTRRGEAGARNTAILNSNSEYVAFLDDDDEWYPEKLQMEVELLDNSDQKVGGIYTGYIRVDNGNGRVLGEKIPEKRGDLYPDMGLENVIGGPSTVLLRRKCFERVGLFDESIGYGTDWDMWIRILKEFHFDYIDKPLVKYRVHENQMTKNLEITTRGLEKVLAKNRSLFVSDRKNFSSFYSSLGYDYREIGKLGKGSKALLKAILVYPFQSKYYTDLLKMIGILILGRKNFLRMRELKAGALARFSRREKK
jgi:glycosyltransferase involved in cell wall biosynthesis